MKEDLAYDILPRHCRCCCRCYTIMNYTLLLYPCVIVDDGVKDENDDAASRYRLSKLDCRATYPSRLAGGRDTAATEGIVYLGGKRQMVERNADIARYMTILTTMTKTMT